MKQGGYQTVMSKNY